MPPKEPEKGLTVNFRVTNEEVAAELLRRTKESGRDSHHGVARELLTEALTRSDSDRQAMEKLQNQLAEIRDQIQELRDDLSSAVNLLLVKAGQLSEEQAHAWCEKTLLHE